MTGDIRLDGASIVGLVIGVVFGLLIGGWIVRAACDLSSVDPPSFLKAILLYLIYSVLAGGAGFAIVTVAGGMINSLKGDAESVKLVSTAVVIVGIVAYLLAGCLIATALYVLALRVRVLKGARIWLFQLGVTA